MRGCGNVGKPGGRVGAELDLKLMRGWQSSCSKDSENQKAEEYSRLGNTDYKGGNQLSKWGWVTA